ncbi:MAG: DUF1566 domain-containing protein [Campylobacterota bacterium]|nr:DUF1566 domain-containing protein [Campylobacterota bacterium]
MQKYIMLFFVGLLIGTDCLADEKGLVGAVVDERNGIYWQDDISSQKSSEDWDDAVLYCDKLVLSGMDHWRLPTFKELFSIVDYSRANPSINPIFSYVDSGTYWTSTNFAPTTSRAWTVDFRTGETYYNYKTTNHTVRCVKDMRSKAAKEGI